MNKISLLIIFLLIISVKITAHEVALHYALQGTQNYDGEEIKGWDVNFLTLDWGNNDFSDYAVSVKFTFIKSDVSKIVLSKAWKRFDLGRQWDFTVGKQQYAFGLFSGSGCG